MELDQQLHAPPIQRGNNSTAVTLRTLKRCRGSSGSSRCPSDRKRWSRYSTMGLLSIRTASPSAKSKPVSSVECQVQAAKAMNTHESTLAAGECIPISTGTFPGCSFRLADWYKSVNSYTQSKRIELVVDGILQVLWRRTPIDTQRFTNLRAVGEIHSHSLVFDTLLLQSNPHPAYHAFAMVPSQQRATCMRITSVTNLCSQQSLWLSPVRVWAGACSTSTRTSGSVQHGRINQHVYKQQRHHQSCEESQDGTSDCHLSRRTSTLSPTWLMRFPQLGGRPFYESAPIHLRTGSIAETLGVPQTGVNDC